MALSDVLKRYGEGATEGIMTPSANVQSVTTEQEVYDSATDGIMTINNEQYIGPSATVTYGGEDTAYSRMLKEIEQGELPQFDQSTFPAVGTGVMQPSTPVTQPVETTPVEQTQFDPCPQGYKLINGVCQLVNPQQADNRGGGGKTFTGPKISKEGIIDGYKPALSRAEGSLTAGGLNSIKMQQLENEHGAAFASKIGLINQKYRNRGVQISETGLSPNDPEIKRLQSVYGQERVDADYTLSKDGKYYRIIATSPKPSEVAGDFVGAVGDIMEGVATEGVGFVGAGKAILNELNELLIGQEETKPESEVKPSEIPDDAPKGPPFNTQVDTTTDRPEPTQVPTLTMEDFGGIDNISNLANTYSSDFGIIRTFLETAKDLEDRLDKMEKRPPQLKNKDSEKRARNNLKIKIAQNEKAKNEKLKEAKDNEKKLQNEINNSKESDFVVKGQTFTAHRDSGNKIIGYSSKGSNVVNMAGMPPIGPGQRIKTSTASKLQSNFKKIRSGK